MSHVLPESSIRARTKKSTTAPAAAARKRRMPRQGFSPASGDEWLRYLATGAAPSVRQAKGAEASSLVPASLLAHDTVTAGLSVKAFNSFAGSFRIVPARELLKAIGLSERTAQRLKTTPSKSLDVNASDRVVQLAKVRILAADVLGTQDAAEQWLIEPAFGLEQRRPIDLMRSTDGINLVTQLLSRMHYGVYA